ncbi:MAG: PIG-L family deacetylase [Chitinophagaceae bacterium]
MRNALFVNLVLFISILATPTYVCSQSPQNITSADMYQGLQKLNVLGTVLYVAAHPDDENTRLIAYLSKDKLYRTGYLSMTRGDGGQNLIGDEQGIELGLIRTQELLSARRIDGGEQFFTRAFDFGFSKGPEETFTKWDKEKILSDVVWVIRKFQPDVIITRFPTTGEGGHGHHTASAILANEAFKAAADPTRFPEQLKYVKPWQAKRILWNTFNFGGTNTTRPDQMIINVGGYNPLLGKSYGEIAAESRSQHKSQGFGATASRGEALEYFATTGGSVAKTDLMDDIDISWYKIKGGAAIGKMIDALIASFNLSHPEKSVSGLVKLYKSIGALEDGYWKTKKLEEVKKLIAQCSGLFIDATTNTQFAVQTDSVRINITLNNRLGADAVLQKISIDNIDSSFSQTLAPDINFNFSRNIYVSPSKSLTQPYWLENKMAEGYYNVTNALKIGQPDIDPAYQVNIRLKIAGEELVFTSSVKYRFTDPVKGEIYEPLVVIPAISVKATPEITVSHPYNLTIPNSLFLAEKDARLDITSYKRANKIELDENAGNKIVYSGEMDKSTIRTVFPTDDTASRIAMRKMSADLVANHDLLYHDTVFYHYNANQMAYHLNSIRYDHIPYQVYFMPTRKVNTNFYYETYNRKIGYIVGAGDKVPDALEQMGYEVTLLTNKELSRNNLSQYDAIITGVRAYNTNEWMNDYYDKLMEYVNNGGNLIVQYNTSNNVGPIRAKMGPFDFNVSRTRVTDENAEVTFLKPEHPVLNFPNKITQADFKGWIQERSIYHASGFDGTKFETIFSMHDPNESADNGSLIIAKYGKGYFTYTGLVFFRELPAGVPGAYRLMANIIALNRKKAF